MTPRERSGDFAQVAYQVVKEATADDDEATSSEDDDKDEPNEPAQAEEAS
jgi:hypothetical protein